MEAGRGRGGKITIKNGKKGDGLPHKNLLVPV